MDKIEYIADKEPCSLCAKPFLTNSPKTGVVKGDFTAYAKLVNVPLVKEKSALYKKISAAQDKVISCLRCFKASKRDYGRFYDSDDSDHDYSLI
jgi:hypothetical protein